jgi:DNA phosphorothioation-dependent restriction protein DptG
MECFILQVTCTILICFSKSPIKNLPKIQSSVNFLFPLYRSKNALWTCSCLSTSVTTFFCKAWTLLCCQTVNKSLKLQKMGDHFVHTWYKHDEPTWINDVVPSCCYSIICPLLWQLVYNLRTCTFTYATIQAHSSHCSWHYPPLVFRLGNYWSKCW